MDRRGIAEAGGAALVSAGLAVAGLWLFAGRIDWIPVVGLAAGVAIAAAANYRARNRHADHVATEAPTVTAENHRGFGPETARDGGDPADDGPRDDPHRVSRQQDDQRN